MTSTGWNACLIGLFNSNPRAAQVVKTTLKTFLEMNMKMKKVREVGFLS